jgi:hypothetical protein
MKKLQKQQNSIYIRFYAYLHQCVPGDTYNILKYNITN